MTREQFLTLFPNASATTLARNGFGPVAGLQDPQREPNQRRESQDRELDKSKEGLVFSITIISIRKRLVDAHDNLRTGAKPLVDQITRSLGFSGDDNPRLRWEYGQIIGSKEGTLVRIERLK